MNAVIDVKHDLQEVVKFWCDPIPDMDSVSHFALLTYLSHLRHAGCAPLSDTVYSIMFLHFYSVKGLCICLSNWHVCIVG